MSRSTCEGPCPRGCKACRAGRSAACRADVATRLLYNLRARAKVDPGAWTKDDVRRLLERWKPSAAVLEVVASSTPRLSIRKVDPGKPLVPENAEVFLFSMSG